jgi:hypothetical protein
LENLDVHAAYDFTLYGSAANLADYSLFTAKGQLTHQSFLDHMLQNDSQVGLIDGVIPDASGKIVLTFEGRRPDGSLQIASTNDDAMGRLNFMQITARFLAIDGDYNGDRLVDLADYYLWKQEFGTTNAAADGNRNGVVDAADYTVWRNAVGGSGLTTGLAASTTVPEPNSCALALIACLSGFLKRRRR